MTMTFEELRSKSDEDLIREHNRLAKDTFVGINYFLEELARRRTERQTSTIRRLSWGVFILTTIITVMTGLSLWAILRST